MHGTLSLIFHGGPLQDTLLDKERGKDKFEVIQLFMERI